MSTLYNADLKSLQPGVFTHPYNHASKLFIGDTFRLAPKQSFLYYVVIEIDPTQTQLGGGVLGQALSFVDKFTNLQNGLLVKKIELPKYNIGTKTMNSYNRKNVIQTNITYEPITVTFHDDAADVVTKFWNDYYTYYFRDSDYNTEAYRTAHRYQARNKLGWGYSPHNGGVAITNNGQLTSFIKTIRIFSLHNKRFTEYRLINPFISSWRHGQHDAYGDGNIMENTMVVEYETVKYFTGYINPVDVLGFSLLNYDTTSSPISNSVTNIYSDTGILGAIDNSTKDLARPDAAGGAGGPLSSVLSAYRLYNNLKNVNIKTVLGTTLAQAGGSVLSQAINTATAYAFPKMGLGSTQTQNNSTYGVNGSALGYPYRAVTIAGAAASGVVGAAINAQNQFLGQAVSDVNRGVSGLVNPATSSYNTTVYDSQNNNGTVVINPQTQQPVTGSMTTYVMDSEGKVISSIQATTTQSGQYNPSNLTENLVLTTQTTDQSGRSIIINQYKDGTQVRYDADTGNQLELKPGGINQTNDININPTNASTLAKNGFNTSPTGVQYYTNPTTGLTYTVGNTTSAMLTNSVSTGIGVISGGVVGAQLNKSLTNVFGTSVIGRTVSGAISAGAGAVVGRAVNNGLQPILNPITGSIVQGFDKATDNIRNVVGSWVGTGGYDPSKPLSNIVTKQQFDDGSSLFTYKDGTTRSIDSTGKEQIVPGTNNIGFTSFWNKTPGVNTDSAQSGAKFATVWTDSSGVPIQPDSGGYLTDDGDKQLLPTPMTNEQWDNMNEQTIAATNDWAGTNQEPYTTPDTPDQYYTD